MTKIEFIERYRFKFDITKLDDATMEVKTILTNIDGTIHYYAFSDTLNLHDLRDIVENPNIQPRLLNWTYSMVEDTMKRFQVELFAKLLEIEDFYPNDRILEEDISIYFL